MAYQDMREFLAQLEEAGQLRRISVPFNVERGRNELQALMRHLAETDGPALVLDKLEGYNTPGVPLVFNPYGTRERTAMILGTRDPLEAKLRHVRVLQEPSGWIKPKLVDRARAPCKEVVIPREKVSVDQHIPHVFFGREGSSYITGGVVVTKDPETGVRNVGAYRVTSFWNSEHPQGGRYSEEQMKKQLSLFAFWNPPMNHIGLHLAKAQKLGRPLELAIACQVDPALHLACATGIPFGMDEYDYAGGLRGSPVELVKCESVDLEVPATAEYIIEGVFRPDVPSDIIGWHSNSVGYYDKHQIFPIFDITTITHRKDPLWYGTIEMMPPFDHNYMALMPVEGELLADLQRKIPEVKDAVVTPNMTYIVQLAVDGASKPHPEFGKYVLHAAWGAAGRWPRTAKLLVVVGPDVNPYDLQAVEWAILTRVQPYSDVIINRSGQAMVLDPSAPKGPQGFPTTSEQMGIDATIKVPERFSDYAEVSQADPEQVRRVARKLAGVL
ncbi:MAG: UbiD family decarboxylase [Gammaproteobacteria bacterium]|nr:MAG: UbiD family decarboxylase [Gammaproteobacteria bacterium]